jgi:CheY-like chemotaxis protein
MKTILIVDDEPHMRRLIEHNVVKAGFRCVAATDGSRALAVLRAEKVDLVVLDMLMPVLDGLGVLREMRVSDELRGVPVIMLTGQGQAGPQQEAKALGASELLTKPFSPTELIGHIRRLTGESVEVS